MPPCLGYHARVHDSGPVEPPFDPVWLRGVAAAVAEAETRVSPRLEDVYLERRLDVRVSARNGAAVAEECRSDGLAARWTVGTRLVLLARTGTSAEALNEVLAPYARGMTLPDRRPLPAAELDAPREWRRWAEKLAADISGAALDLRLIQRRAVVIRDGSWSVAETPPLVRARRLGKAASALLAVHDHPSLGIWLREMLAPPPARTWAPESRSRLPVLFAGGTAGALLHELVGHLAESDLTARGLSPFAALAGAEIASHGVTIVDDPRRRDLPGGFTADDEGVEARPIHLLSDGVLSGWLCDRRGGRLLGHAPGRGRRATWDHPPVARMSNLVMAPGTTRPQDIERDLQNGLVVSRLSGATVDPTSGRVVIRIERGWEIRHGRRRRELGQFHLTGSALNLLADIDPAVGDDPQPEWRLGWCVKNGLPIATGSEAPTILVRQLEVL